MKSRIVVVPLVSAVALVLMVASVLAVPSAGVEAPNGLVMYYSGGENTLVYGLVTPNTADHMAENEIVLTNLNEEIRYTSFTFTFQDLVGGSQNLDMRGNYYLSVRDNAEYVGTFEASDHEATFDYNLDFNDVLYVRPFIGTVPSFCQGNYSGSFMLATAYVPVEEGAFAIGSQERGGSSTLQIPGTVSCTHDYTVNINGYEAVYIQSATAGGSNYYSGGGVGTFSLSYCYIDITNTGNEYVNKVKFTFTSANLVRTGGSETIPIASRVEARRAHLENPAWGWGLFTGASPYYEFTTPQGYIGLIETHAYFEFGVTDIPVGTVAGVYTAQFQIMVTGQSGGTFTDGTNGILMVEVPEAGGPGITGISLDYVNQGTGADDGSSVLGFGTVTPNSQATSTNAYKIQNTGETKIHYCWIHFNDFWPTETGNPGRIQVGGNAFTVKTPGGATYETAMNANGNCAIITNLEPDESTWFWLEITDVGAPPAGSYQSDFKVQGTHNIVLGDSDATNAGMGLLDWGTFDGANVPSPDNPYWSPAYYPLDVQDPYLDIRSMTVDGVAGGAMEQNQLVTITYSDNATGLRWSALNRGDGLPDMAENTLIVHNDANTPIQRVIFQFGLFYSNETGEPLFMRPVGIVDSTTFTGETVGTGDFRLEQVTITTTINVGSEKEFQWQLPDASIDTNYDDEMTYIAEFTPVIQRNSFSGDPLIETLAPQVAWVSPTGEEPDGGGTSTPSIIAISKTTDNATLKVNYTHMTTVTLTVNTATRVVRVKLGDGSPLSTFNIEVTKMVGSSRVNIMDAEDVDYADIPTNSAGDYTVILYLTPTERGEFDVPVEFTGFNSTTLDVAHKGNTELLTVSLTVQTGDIMEILADYAIYIIVGIAGAVIAVALVWYMVKKKREQGQFEFMSPGAQEGPSAGNLAPSEGEEPFEDFTAEEPDTISSASARRYRRK